MSALWNGETCLAGGKAVSCHRSPKRRPKAVSCHRTPKAAPPYPDQPSRLSALNTAFTEASSMFVSTPAPQRLWPSAVLIWI